MQLIRGNCLAEMPKLPDGSVDLILCDPPYGSTEMRWDKAIPVKPMWEQFRRIVNPGGVICIFGTEPFSTALRSEAMDLYKYDWIWVKNQKTRFNHAHNMPLRQHELISVFSPANVGHRCQLGDRRMPYNPQGLKRVDRIKKGMLPRPGGYKCLRPSSRDEYLQEYTNFPTDVLYFRKDPEVLHSSQKPVALLEYLIRTYTDPGALVLDCCMGSGSTGVACVRTGRDFIGIELSERFFQTAEERIRKAQEEAAGGDSPPDSGNGGSSAGS